MSHARISPMSFSNSKTMTSNSLHQSNDTYYWSCTMISRSKHKPSSYSPSQYCFNNNSVMASRNLSSHLSSSSHISSKKSPTMSYNLIYCFWSLILLFIFWAFFHSSLSPTVEIGTSWPPAGIQPFNPFQIPLLNTTILISSGATVTWAHHSITESKHSEAIQSLLLTILLGLYYTGLQALEYFGATFTIADSVYGSTFFVATGFHGLHVIIGTAFLSVCLHQLYMCHFSSSHHFGFEAAEWYWHFVEVVWLFLYICIYWWGG